jgi:hypothetical protein
MLKELAQRFDASVNGIGRSLTGYQSEAAMAPLAMEQPETEVVIALGREGKALAKPGDAKKHPHKLAMAAKLETEPTIDNANDWLSRPMAGSRTCWGFAGRMRGLTKVQAEFKLVCMTLNLRRMGVMQMA